MLALSSRRSIPPRTRPEPSDLEHRELLERYVAAFEDADMATLAKLLREDVTIEIPPVATWFSGRDAVTRFLEFRVFDARNDWRMLLTRANGQLAMASYLRQSDGAYNAHGIQLLTCIDGGIERIVAFRDTSLFTTFGLPPVADGADS